MLLNGVSRYTAHATCRSFNEIFLKGINNGLPMAQPWYGWIYVVLFVIVMIHSIVCPIGLQNNSNSWLLHDTFSILPGLYKGNPLATSSFPHKGLVMWTFGIFLIARLNKLFSIQIVHFMQFQMPWYSCDVTVMWQQEPFMTIETCFTNTVYWRSQPV